MNRIFVIALSIMLLANSNLVFSQEVISLSETYDSAYFYLKFDYPTGWEIIEQPGGPMVLNYDYNNSQPYETGHARMQFWPPEMLADLKTRDINVNTNGPIELLTSLRSIFDSDERDQMGPATSITLNGIKAARADGKFLGNPTIFLAVCALKDDCIMIFGDTHDDEFADSEQLFLQIAASVQYIPRQFSGELAAITPDNASTIARYQSLRWLDRRTGQTDYVSLSNDGKLAASALGYDGLKLWDLTTGELVQHFEDVKANQMTFLPNSEQLVVVYPQEEYFNVISLDNYDTVTISSEDELSSIAVTPDGKTMVTGGWSGKIQLWDTSSFTVLQTLDEISDLRIDAVGASETHFATSHEEGQVALYSLESEEVQLLSIIEGRANALSFSVDGTRLAVITSKNKYLVFDVANSKQILDGNGASDFTSSAALNQDGSLLALTTEGDGLIWLIDVATGKLLAELQQGGDEVSAVVFSSDDKMLLAGGYYDETLILWAVP